MVVRVRRMSLKLIPGLVLLSALVFLPSLAEAEEGEEVGGLLEVVDFEVDLCRRELGWDLDLDIIAMARGERSAKDEGAE